MADRLQVKNLHELMVAAIDDPKGEARGVLTSDIARAATRTFKASGPILVDVATERRYKQPGCSRLKLTFSQDGVHMPGESSPRKRTMDVGINYCRDGAPPASLS